MRKRLNTKLGDGVHNQRKQNTLNAIQWYQMLYESIYYTQVRYIWEFPLNRIFSNEIIYVNIFFFS